MARDLCQSFSLPQTTLLSANDYNLLAVVGATATGKTRLGVALARCLSGEVISADSRQVFRGLDLGTGKDLGDYGEIRYHLIDCVDPETEFSVFDFQERCYQAIREIRNRGNLPCLVGGSGLYLESILLGYQMIAAPENPELRHKLARFSDEELKGYLVAIKPRLHNVTDFGSRARIMRAIEIAQAGTVFIPPALPEQNVLVLGIHWPRALLRNRIKIRLKQRLEGGLIEEVQGLLAQGISHARLESLGLEYRWVSHLLQKKITIEDLQEGLARAISQFAKRQETWFRRMERRGVVIKWLAGNDNLLPAALETCARVGWTVSLKHDASQTCPPSDHQ